MSTINWSRSLRDAGEALVESTILFSRVHRSRMSQINLNIWLLAAIGPSKNKSYTSVVKAKLVWGLFEKIEFDHNNAFPKFRYTAMGPKFSLRDFYVVTC